MTIPTGERWVQDIGKAVRRPEKIVDEGTARQMDAEDLRHLVQHDDGTESGLEADQTGSEMKSATKPNRRTAAEGSASMPLVTVPTR